VVAPPALGLPAEEPTTLDAEPAAAAAEVEPEEVPLPPVEADLASPERNAAWLAVNDPATPAARLAELVGEYPEFGATVAAHPQCYPELRQWIADYVSPAR
jgi:DNA-binding transcriptional MocR family regulator